MRTFALVFFLALSIAMAGEPPAIPVSAPRVEYPVAAKEKKFGGEGLYRLHLDARGLVTKVEIVRSSGHAILDREALGTLKRWRFKPGPKIVRFPVTWSIP